MKKNETSGKTPEEVAEKTINSFDNKIEEINRKMHKNQFGRPLIKFYIKDKEKAKKDLKESLTRSIKDFK